MITMMKRRKQSNITTNWANRRATQNLHPQLIVRLKITFHTRWKCSRRSMQTRLFWKRMGSSLRKDSIHSSRECLTTLYKLTQHARLAYLCSQVMLVWQNRQWLLLSKTLRDQSLNMQKRSFSSSATNHSRLPSEPNLLWYAMRYENILDATISYMDFSTKARGKNGNNQQY